MYSFSTTTGPNGGYTIKVPDVGRYRLEVELRDGEVVAKGPEETEINNGDLDPGRISRSLSNLPARLGTQRIGAHRT